MITLINSSSNQTQQYIENKTGSKNLGYVAKYGVVLNR